MFDPKSVKKIDIHAHVLAFPEYTPFYRPGDPKSQWICAEDLIEMYDRLGIETGKCQHKTDYLKEAHIQIRDDGWFEDYPYSYAAEVDPVDCNARIGKAAFRWEVERIAHAYKVLKEDENLLKWLDERQKGWECCIQRSMS